MLFVKLNAFLIAVVSDLCEQLIFADTYFLILLKIAQSVFY